MVSEHHDHFDTQAIGYALVPNATSAPSYSSKCDTRVDLFIKARVVNVKGVEAHTVIPRARTTTSVHSDSHSTSVRTRERSLTSENHWKLKVAERTKSRQEDGSRRPGSV